MTVGIQETMILRRSQSYIAVQSKTYSEPAGPSRLSQFSCGSRCHSRSFSCCHTVARGHWYARRRDQRRRRDPRDVYSAEGHGRAGTDLTSNCTYAVPPTIFSMLSIAMDRPRWRRDDDDVEVTLQVRGISQPWRRKTCLTTELRCEMMEVSGRNVPHNVRCSCEPRA